MSWKQLQPPDNLINDGRSIIHIFYRRMYFSWRVFFRIVGIAYCLGVVSDLLLWIRFLLVQLIRGVVNLCLGSTQITTFKFDHYTLTEWGILITYHVLPNSNSSKPRETYSIKPVTILNLTRRTWVHEQSKNLLYQWIPKMEDWLVQIQHNQWKRSHPQEWIWVLDSSEFDICHSFCDSKTKMITVTWKDYVL